MSPTRPHGRRDELRAARRMLHDRSASLEQRAVALETLRELLEATRSSGRPAHSLRLEAAKAILSNPLLYELIYLMEIKEARARRRLGRDR